ncbi:hypothetical protein CYMTET_19354 [Cymbomonas tetramitiformis]|uniref:Uncharacterized protein n=1 Tax=Cymbomonas tetramitiformis TaxID=36881 RepID=A0AAE0G6S8_9CHLO|nr:hypothetical protein CYMTET_45657 [Cymbomonas tetramitiformis]KAK3272355.1 hypothetical protein CYMTET_19354 [Cymbomonas tetramitiformis]
MDTRLLRADGAAVEVGGVGSPADGLTPTRPAAIPPSTYGWPDGWYWRVDVRQTGWAWRPWPSEPPTVAQPLPVPPSPGHALPSPDYTPPPSDDDDDEGINMSTSSTPSISLTHDLLTVRRVLAYAVRQLMSFTQVKK